MSWSSAGSSRACTTQKTRSGQWPHTLALRRIVVSSSCSPPSCTIHQMSIGRVMRPPESGMCSMPLMTMSAWLYAAAVSSSRTICTSRPGMERHALDQPSITVLG